MTFNSKCYVHPMFKFVYVLSVPNGHEDEDNVSAQPQTVAGTRYAGEPEPSYPRSDLTYAKTSFTSKTTKKTTTKSLHDFAH